MEKNIINKSMFCSPINESSVTIRQWILACLWPSKNIWSRKRCHENRIVWGRAKQEMWIYLLLEEKCFRKLHACFDLWLKFLFHGVAFFWQSSQNNATFYDIFVGKRKFCKSVLPNINLKTGHFIYKL